MPRPAAAFSDRLREARERRGLSQAELAERSGLQSTAVSHFENGRRSPSFDNLKRLADALNVTTDYLLGRSNDPAASGPETAALFRDAKNLTAEDLDTLSQMARILAQKKTRDKPGEGR